MPTTNNHEPLHVDGVEFLPARTAGRSVGYTSDYITKLAREEKLEAKRIGRQWFVSSDSLQKFVEESRQAQEYRKAELSKERKAEQQVALAEPMPRALVPRNLRALALLQTAFVLCFGVLLGTGGYVLKDDVANVSYDATALHTLATEKINNFAYRTYTDVEHAASNTHAFLTDTAEPLLALELDHHLKTQRVAVAQQASVIASMGETICNNFSLFLTQFGFCDTANEQVIVVETNPPEQDEVVSAPQPAESTVPPSVVTRYITTTASQGITAAQLEERLALLRFTVDTSGLTEQVMRLREALKYTDTRTRRQDESDRDDLNDNIDDSIAAITTDGTFTNPTITGGTLSNTTISNSTLSGTSTFSGPLKLSQITAPSPTTDYLYNVAGDLFWNGTNISTGGGGSGSVGTSTTPNAGDLAYWTSASTLGTVATGTLSTSATGLEFSAARGLIGGGATLALTSGYTIPTIASTTAWENKIGSQWTTSGSDIYYDGGNVGIGTTTPSSELTVIGDGLFSGGNVTASTLTATSSIATPEVAFGNTNRVIRTGTYNGEIGIGNAGGNFFYLNGNSKGFNVQSTGSLNWTNSTASITGDSTVDTGLSRLSAGVVGVGNGTAGNTSGTLIANSIGVGDSSPLYSFTVGDGDLFGVNSSGAIAAATGITSSGTITFSDLTGGILTTDGSGVLSTTTIAASDLSLTNGYVFRGSSANVAEATSTLFIADSGNVGIGATSPEGKLHITGTADDQQLIVRANATQTARIQEWQNSSGTALSSIDSTGALVNLVSDCSKYVLFSSSATYIKNTTCGARLPYLGIGTDGNATNAITVSYSGNAGGVVYGISANTTNISTGGVGGFYTKRTHNNAGTATNAYGLNVDALTVSSGAVTNNYAAYLNPGTAGTNNYGVYQVGSTVNNYFAGNIGIGTASPSAKLDVAGIAEFNPGATAFTIEDHSTPGAGTALKAAGANLDFWVNGTGRALTLDNGGLTVRDTRNFRVGTSNFFVNGSTGNVGIGTTDPSAAKLQIENGSGVADIALEANAASSAVIRFGDSANNNAAQISYSNSTDLLSLVTGGSSRLTVTNTGNVGIGTTTPDSKLHVSGASQTQLRIETTSGTSDTGIRFIDPNNTWAAGVNIGNTLAGSFNVYDISNGRAPFTIAEGAANNSLYINSTGNVGVGTASPSAKLHVAGDDNGSGGSVSGQLRISGATDPNQRLLLGYDTNDNFGWIQATQAGSAFRNLVLNQSGGNVGIGTTSPATTLSVAGNGYLTGGLGVGVLNTTAGTLRTSGNATIGGNTLTIGSNALSLSQNGFALQASNSFAVPGGVFAVGTTVNGTLAMRIVPSSATQRGIAVEAASGQSASLIEATSYNGSAGDLFTLNGSGNVGIGTTSPANKLHVYSALTDIYSHIQTASSNGQAGLYLQNDANTWLTKVDSSDRFMIRDDTAGVDALTILKSSGNVGIGTASPGSKLEVAGNVKSTGWYQFTGSAQRLTSDGTGLSINSVSAGGYVTLNSPAGEVLRASDTGNVGIGTTSPSAKLDIIGKTLFAPDVSDGASAVAYNFDTSNTLSTSGAKLLSIKNGGTERFSLAHNGAAILTSTASANNDYVFTINTGGASPAFRLDAQGDVEIARQVSIGNAVLGNTASGASQVTYGGSGIVVNRNATFNISHQTQVADVATSELSITGKTAFASAVTNLDGGNLVFTAGSGASGSAGDADGGSILIDGGQGYGTGSHGNIALGSTRGNVGIGTATATSKLTVAHTNSTADVDQYAQHVDYTDTANAGGVDLVKASGLFEAAYSGTYSGGGFGYQIGGITGRATFSGTLNGGGGGDELRLRGVYGDALGSSATVVDASDILYVMGVDGRASGNLGTTGQTFHYGLQATALGTADRNVGLHIGTVSGATENFAIYSGATADSYFAGSVGIGTTTPSSKLHILGSSQNELIVDASAGNPDILFQELGVSSGQLFATNGAFRFQYANGGVGGSLTNGFTIGNDGNVGIGTTGPVTKFAIDTSSGSTTANIATINAPAAYTGNWIDLQSNGTSAFQISQIFNVDHYEPILYNPDATPANAAIRLGNSTGYFRIIPFTDDTTYVQSSLSNLTFSGLNAAQGATSTFNYAESKFTGAIQSDDLLGGATNLTTDASGNIIRDPSDENLKTEIHTVENALEKILGLRGVSYEWKDKNRFGSQTELGFIAQEVEPILPEVVRKGGDYWSLNTRNILAVVVEAMKEMWGKITQNEDRINELEARIQMLEAQLGTEQVADDSSNNTDNGSGDDTSTGTTTPDVIVEDETASSTPDGGDTATTTDSGAEEIQEETSVENTEATEETVEEDTEEVVEEPETPAEEVVEEEPEPASDPEPTPEPESTPEPAAE